MVQEKINGVVIFQRNEGLVWDDAKIYISDGTRTRSVGNLSGGSEEWRQILLC